MSSFRQRQLPVLLLFLLACSATGGEKPSCAVLSLDALAGANKEEAALLSDRLTSEVWNTDKYVIIARQKVKDIPAVQAINQSNTWSATDVAVEIGRAISVKYVICGSLGHIDSLYTINTSLVDTETARVVKTMATDHRGGFESLLTNAIKKNVEQLLDIREPAVLHAGANAAVARVKTPRIRIKSH